MVTVAPTTSGGSPSGMPSTGTLYLSRDNVGELYAIDTTDGSATLIGTTGTTSNTVGLTEGSPSLRRISRAWPPTNPSFTG